MPLDVLVGKAEGWFFGKVAGVIGGADVQADVILLAGQGYWRPVTLAPGIRVLELVTQGGALRFSLREALASPDEPPGGCGFTPAITGTGGLSFCQASSWAANSLNAFA